MLTIRNINKIIGSKLDCRWLPNAKGWVVKDIEAVGDTYCFELKNTNSDARFQNAEIQLRREPVIREGKTEYEMWAWNLENNMPEVKWNKLKDLETVKDGVLWIGYVLDKILPSK